jgi:two-component system, OmpR family, response regulator RstA
MSQSNRIIIVEDDERLAELVSNFFQRNGFEVTVEGDGAAAIELIPKEAPDLVILDVMLPGADGFEVCRQIRPKFKGPILMLTARGDEIDQVVGLELGADDYVAKPASPRLLLARVRALLRRGAAKGDEEKNRLVFDELVVDRSTREVSLDGENLEFSTAEFDLLWFLASRAGKALSRQDILQELRGIDYDGIDRSIDMRVSKLRQKIGDISNPPKRIKTIRGVGYLFVPAQ